MACVIYIPWYALIAWMGKASALCERLKVVLCALNGNEVRRCIGGLVVVLVCPMKIIGPRMYIMSDKGCS